MQLLRFYIRPGPPETLGDTQGGVPSRGGGLLGSPLRLARAVEPKVTAVTTETCYYLAWEGATPPDAEQCQVLRWLLGSPLGGHQEVTSSSSLRAQEGQILLEIGPRLGVCTASSTNAVSLCQAAGLAQVQRLERSRRLLLQFDGHPPEGAEARLGRALRDPMTEQLYPEPLGTLAVPSCPAPVTTIDVLAEGSRALERADRELGLAFDSWDLQYYTNLFLSVGRNPTSVECFDLAQSNSEHSRHWFFKGRLVVDGKEEPESLFQLLMGTQESSNPNNVIKFCDNSSAIRGASVTSLWPQDPSGPSPFQLKASIRHLLFTAETHNFPTAVAPFSGATTGTGGRIRDVQCTGRGAQVIAGTAGYSFGNLLLPGYELPWEDPAQPYPEAFARPLEVAIGASDGASDYGNKFGEPLLAGFARSFGQVVPGGQRREWLKPIMFSGGIGALEDLHVRKEPPEPGMLVVKVGGPVYRIGVGGGAASSIQVQGDNSEERDLGAVQRGDPEMEQKLHRLLRGCCEAAGGQHNPICSIHDQGAGGNGNVLKELSEPAGAVIYASRFQLGDPSLSLLELWGAEYQESNALLARPSGLALLRRLARRERCPLCVVGTVTGDGKIVLVDDLEQPVPEGGSHQGLPTPVNLELEWVLGKMPRKVFRLQRAAPALRPLALPPGLQVAEALQRVLRLPAVGSKRYLTNKVDRSVSGLVAQQQCVGPLQTPLADVAVVALSPWHTLGGATSLGEQPIKGLLDPGAGARLALAEAITNLTFAPVTCLKDVKCSGNWMWGAKSGAEGGALLAACQALVALMKALGVAIDGGKDSLSMAARVGTQTVMAPGTVVVSAYALCPDITATVTPDLKCPQGKGTILWVQLSPGQHRLGGTALAQVYCQLGDSCPDLEDPQGLAAAFGVVQELLRERALSAGHDVSDGGLLGCLLEMAFAGNCGLQVEIPCVPRGTAPLAVLFSEEPGLLLEVPGGTALGICRRFQEAGVCCTPIGHSGPYGPQALVQVAVAGTELLSAPVGHLRGIWEATSCQLERLQAVPGCVEQEELALGTRQGLSFSLTFDYLQEPPLLRHMELPGPRVAVLREEGSNGDREMAAAFAMAGCQVWDVTTEDLCSGSATLDGFRGLAFVGGFSYADVLGSAKGWAAAVRFHPRVKELLERFRRRPDTFSLGVCNGCQLMALLGWVGPQQSEPGAPPAVVLSPNLSGRFESRFVAVRVEPGPALMLQGMEGSCLGVWVAHGEGRFEFREPSGLGAALGAALVPLRYADDSGAAAASYPYNPNGSGGAAAALCSPCGRHLAVMPHPERGVLSWQWPWWPPAWPRPHLASREGLKVAPWLRMFQNATEWCLRWPQGEC